MCDFKRKFNHCYLSLLSPHTYEPRSICTTGSINVRDVSCPQTHRIVKETPEGCLDIQLPFLWITNKFTTEHPRRYLQLF